MEPSTATQTLDFLTDSILAASSGLEEWAWALVTVLVFFQVVYGYTKKVVAGDPLSLRFFGEAVLSWAMTVIVVSIYFSLSFPLMEKMREFGMFLSGSSLDTVDIGELFRQREVVSERIYTTIDSFKELSIWDQVKSVPEILMLNGLGSGVFVEYAFIALIAVWVYAKFCLGYLTGGIFIGGLASDQMFDYGRRSFSYVITSTQPLFLLAFMQGVSSRLLEQAPVLNGAVPITVPALWNLGFLLMFVIILCLVAVKVPSEWLHSVVSSSGAPDGSRTVGTFGGVGGAIISSMRSISSSLSRLEGGGGRSSGSNVGRSLPSPSPASSGASNANAGVPRLGFRQ